ncbi:hypothetical protein ACQKCH_13520 [Nubsella zeaxanthinifaciens]|uniref:hypothetical protein n=1 Tax=Nubsella zeaxanthinifaciens TaxID=392412 RepID=UPI003D012DAE
MKKIVIISPHFPPSNLAAVHRSRLFAQHLPEFGWEPIIVTVHEKYYEEELDPNLEKLLPKELRVVKTNALSTKPIRIIGDIGIRGFYSMYKTTVELIINEKVDFLYIPIPSHFAALLGRLIHKKTGVKYGIDYIDPWVHQWPGTEKKLSKHWWSMKLAEWLEPWAVKNASLITGVAEGYYKDVLERNPHLKRNSLQVAMPYGGEKEDIKILKSLKLKPYLFEKKNGVKDFVYGGAMLPKAFQPLEMVMKAIANNKAFFKDVRIHFIGSGKSPNDPNGYNIKELAMKYGLWESIFFEYPKRIPYLDVLTHLIASEGAFILGSTEPHYTPSKVYQAVLSEKPVFAILHKDSSACEIITKSNVGTTLTFNGENDLSTIEEQLVLKWEEYENFRSQYDTKNINSEAFEQYSAFRVTQILASELDKL